MLKHGFRIKILWMATQEIVFTWCWIYNWKYSIERFQDGDWGTDTDSMSSVNQGTCWDVEAMLGRGEAPGRVETLAPWIPSPWKASPHHHRLREQTGCHPHAATAAGQQLQMCLGEFQQTKQVSAKHHAVSLSHPWDKPVQLNPSPPRQTDPLAKKKKKNQKNKKNPEQSTTDLKTSTQRRGQGNL
jgi:hypothetical protein